MTRRGIQAACAIWLVLSAQAIEARTQAEIRFSSGLEGPAWKGQEIPLYLELWSDGFSFSGQSFSLPDVPGGYLVRGDGSTVNLTERRGSESWQGLRYDIKYFPQTIGINVVPSFKVRFAVTAGFGSELANFEFETAPLKVEVRLPPGADPDALLVTSSRYRLQYQWSPEVTDEESPELTVGDALVLEVERSADDVPGMMFDPLPLPSIDGLGIYADKPDVRDTSNRGQLSSRRVDRVTFVGETAGLYSLPEQVFQSWNPQTGQLSEFRIPPLELVFKPDPAWLPDDAEGAQTFSFSSRLAWALGVSLALGLLGWRFGPGVYRALQARWHSRRAARAASEAGLFRQIRKACRANDPQRAYAATTQWLVKRGVPGGVSLLQAARQSEIAGFEAAVLELQQCLLSGDQWNGATLRDGLLELRRNSRLEGERRGGLPPLNPC